MSIEQRAREIAESLHASPEFVDESDIACARLGIIEGLEMALEIAEEWREDDGSLSQTGSFIGLAIRALIEEQKV